MKLHVGLKSEKKELHDAHVRQYEIAKERNTEVSLDEFLTDEDIVKNKAKTTKKLKSEKEIGSNKAEAPAEKEGSKSNSTPEKSSEINEQPALHYTPEVNTKTHSIVKLGVAYCVALSTFSSYMVYDNFLSGKETDTDRKLKEVSDSINKVHLSLSELSVATDDFKRDMSEQFEVTNLNSKELSKETADTLARVETEITNINKLSGELGVEFDRAHELNNKLEEH